MASAERKEELAECLADVRSRVPEPKLLVAVSKYKPASDIQACLERGQLDSLFDGAESFADINSMFADRHPG